MITEAHLLDSLRTVKYPGFSRDIVSFGLVKGTRKKQVISRRDRIR